MSVKLWNILDNSAYSVINHTIIYDVFTRMFRMNNYNNLIIIQLRLRHLTCKKTIKQRIDFVTFRGFTFSCHQ